jgi:hypothetical protein
MVHGTIVFEEDVWVSWSRGIALSTERSNGIPTTEEIPTTGAVI